MNDNYFVEKWLVTLLMLIVATVFYLESKRITKKSKYSGRAKYYFRIIIASTLSLLFFYSCAFVNIQFGIGHKYLIGMGLVFIPISLLMLVVFTVLFFLKRKS